MGPQFAAQRHTIEESHRKKQKLCGEKAGMGEFDGQSPHQPVYVGVIVVAVIGLACSVASLVKIYLTIRKQHRTTLPAKLLFYLHSTLLVEEVCVLPFVYVQNAGLCKFVGWVQIYSSLSNILSMGLLVLYFVNYLTAYSSELLSKIAKYKVFIIFLFPLITLLPYSTDSYGEAYDVFCGLPSDTETQSLWAIFILHLWLWIILIISFYYLFRVLYKAMKVDASIAKKLLTTVGVYVLVTIVAWLERSIPRVMRVANRDYRSPRVIYIVMVYTVYITSIIYACLLFADPQVIAESKHEFSVDNVSESDDHNIHFKWEDFDEVGSSQNPSSISSNGMELRPSSNSNRPSSIVNTRDSANQNTSHTNNNKRLSNLADEKRSSIGIENKKELPAAEAVVSPLAAGAAGAAEDIP